MALSSRRSDIQTKLSLEFMAAVKQREIEECSNVPCLSSVEQSASLATRVAVFWKDVS